MTGVTLPASMSFFRTAISSFSRLRQEPAQSLAYEWRQHERSQRALRSHEPRTARSSDEYERPLGGECASQVRQRSIARMSRITS